MLSPVQASTPSHAKPETSQSDEKSVADLKNALRELQVEYTTYKREKGENERCVLIRNLHNHRCLSVCRQKALKCIFWLWPRNLLILKL